MNILHISTMTSWGGGEQQIAYLTEQLSRMEIKQIALCAKDSALSKSLNKHKIHFTTLPKDTLSALKWPQTIRDICHQQHIDVIHTHDSRAHTFAVLSNIIRRLSSQTPIVAHRRVSVPVKKSYFSQLKYNHPSVKKIICISSHVRRTLEPAILNPQHLVLIPSSIDLSYFSKLTIKEAEVKKSLGLPPEAKLVLNIGSLKTQKQQATFIRAAKLILDDQRVQDIPLYFFIVGEGELYDELKNLIASLGLTERVKLLGFRKDSHSLLKAASLFMLTSINEGLGNVVMESFACRVPVVASRSGGVVDLITHEVTGLLANPSDEKSFAGCALKLLTDKSFRDSVRDQASEKIKDFDTVAISKKVYDIYAHL